MPDIAVINESTAKADADIERMLAALQLQWNRDLKSVWQVEPASFTFLPTRPPPPPGWWWRLPRQ